MEIQKRPVDRLAEYGQIPIRFEVVSRLDVPALQEGRFVEIPVTPFVKDYDVLWPPETWPLEFDLRHCVQLRTDEAGATVAWRIPGTDLFEGRDDLAALWDLRVAPSARGKGLGRALVLAAFGWARERGCVEMKVETQDINVVACRFYAAMGFRLAEAHPHAYPGLDETMLLWRRRLDDEGPGTGSG